MLERLQLSEKQFSLSIGQQQIVLSAEKSLLLLVLFLAAVLRLGFLSHWSLWTDELYTVLVSDLATLTSSGTPTDQHPPFYYLLTQAILAVGRSEFLLRLPSALGGITAVWLMWRTGKVLERPWLGLLAAALLAFSPLHIWYSREARMYGPATMMWAAGIYFYVSLWRRGRFLDVIGLSAAILAGLYTAYPTLALLWGQIALFLPLWHAAERDQRQLRLWRAALTIIVMGYLPWIPYMFQQFSRESPFDWLGPARTVLGDGLVDQIASFLALLGFESNLAGTLRLAAVGGMVLIGLIWLLSLLLIKRPAVYGRLQSRKSWLAALILLAFLVMTLVGALPRGLSVRRQLLVFWLPVVFLAAWAFLALNRPKLVGTFLVLSLVLGSLTAFGPPHEDWRGVAEFITEEAEANDMVFLPTTGLVAFEYYEYEATPFEGAYTAVLEPEDLPTEGSMWLVFNEHPAFESANRATLAWFEEQGVVVEQYSFSRFIEVYEFRR